jgi:hypothetical protein
MLGGFLGLGSKRKKPARKTVARTKDICTATLAKWSKAPSWAKWYAINAYGDCTWFERKPQRTGDSWVMGGKEERAGKFDVGQSWRSAIEKRP